MTRSSTKSAEKKARTEALVAALKDRAEQFRQSDKALLCFLKSSARFHNYSLSNQYLIFFQNPDASAVNSYKRWGEIGRQVRKGEKAIYIVAPRPYKRKNDKGEEEERVSFVHVPVFAYEQTDPIEGHEHPWEPYRIPSLTEETGGPFVEALLESLREEGHDIECFEDDRAYRGQFRVPGDGEGTGGIALNVSMPALQQLNTLVHEIAHLTHWQLDPLSLRTFGKAAIEFVGEASSYAVLSELGFDSSEKSVAYIGAMGGVDDDKEKVVMSLVCRVVGKIMERIEGLDIPEIREEPAAA